MTGDEKRALVAQALTERADELACAADRIGAENMLVGAAMRTVVDHLRGYIKYRLPFEYQES
ncbi:MULTISPECIES: hypothetical protein [Nocardia]|jgi:DNA-directed RNA polymerase sigma subunit (sigma70/sigma32)|uniref:hypothetical protein n=1 Tax=Nocardia TaxID=1817 RepID=UPI002453A713|nr:hypothetical protein [Nocardia gipuzkoensis]